MNRRGNNSAPRSPIRGYTKLFDAAKHFKYNFHHKVVLDIGSSTGGFTECALAGGAEKVIAVEKGSNQMKTPLRFDSRIELHEKTDIFDFIYNRPFDTIVADVSFLSLTKVLSYSQQNFADAQTDFLVMLKPQFEAKAYQLHNGVIKNERIRRDIIKNFEQWLKANHFIIIGKYDNQLHGKNGNRERFYWLKLESKPHRSKNNPKSINQ